MTEVVWTDAPENFQGRYLREKVVFTASARGAPRCPKHERLVAYSQTPSGAEPDNIYVLPIRPRLFMRTVWVLHQADPPNGLSAYRPTIVLALADNLGV